MRLWALGSLALRLELSIFLQNDFMVHQRHGTNLPFDDPLFAKNIGHPHLIAFIFENVHRFQKQLFFAVLQQVGICFTHHHTSTGFALFLERNPSTAAPSSA
jgi:hypothetical protein